MRRDPPDHRHEDHVRALGARVVAGIDEVGRGPLAGPVVAAAVCLDTARIPAGLADSKTLPAARREALAALIRATCAVGIAEASVAEIDALNILQASHLAMRRAVAALPAPPDHALVDGRLLPGLPCPATGIVRGDALCQSIAAASIVAKVARDAIMADLARDFPGYGWERNMGYPTPHHRAALIRLGVTPHHRRSFRPVHNILWQADSSTR